MNSIDATDRTERSDDAEPPSLLTIILDTNPHAWALMADSLPLSKAVSNLLVFINAHLAINYANRVAVIASHAGRAEWLYPTPSKSHSKGNAHPPDNANKYRPFAHVEHDILTNVRELLSTTTPESITATPSTLMAGALTLALTHISKWSAAPTTANASTQSTYADPSTLAGANDLTNPTQTTANTSANLTPRILLVSASADLSAQYIPLMNAVFAAQRLQIPLDVARLAGDTVFLQQAADATGGVYLALDTPAARAGLLQHLMFAYLPDQTARERLIVPGAGDGVAGDSGAGVDFRAACFCHRRVVDVGYVCSICLSIFCEPVPHSKCLTCGSVLSVGPLGKKPVVVAKAKKKKKKTREGESTGTPESAGATPVPA